MNRSTRLSRRLSTPALCRLLLGPLLLCTLAGCPKKDGDGETAGETTAAPSAEAPPEPSAAAEDEGPKPVEVKAAALDAKGPWLGAFSIKMMADPAADPSKAHQACVKDEMALCSEQQLASACAQEAKLGEKAHWSLTAEPGKGFVVRGGEGKCETRAVAATGDKAVACCSEAIAITTDKKEQAALDASFGKLKAWQDALNQRKGEALKPLLDASVKFNGKPTSDKDFVTQADSFYKSDATFWEQIDSCAVSFQQAADTWTAECKTIKNLNGKLAAVTERMVWSTSQGKLKALTELEIDGKKTPHAGAAGPAGPLNPGNAAGRDGQCRSRCGNGLGVQLTQCYCKCMGLCL